VARVFLSYSHQDDSVAKGLAAAIGAAGHQIWSDRQIHGGSRFATEIDRALKDAEAVVVLWSDASVESAWVQDEAAEGRDSGRLIPVTLSGRKAPLGFRQFQAIDLGNWNGSGQFPRLQELLHAIDETAGCDESAPSAVKAKTSASGHARAGPCVCILPFVNMSGDPEQEYFSDGITEDITTDLSKVSALSVISRNTAFTFKGRATDAKEVARTVDATHVLEGSVRKAGTRIRITAQLIDGNAGDHVWAERYDRELTDIFDIQDEISKSIVGALKLKLLPEESSAIADRGTSSVDAYNLYLMARQRWIGGTFSESRSDAIVRICTQATLLDSHYAQAWALMALAQSELRFWHGRDQDALSAAERALSINPDLPEPHCVRAHYLEQEGRLAEANKEIEIALRLDPDSWEANREAARLMFRQGRVQEAIPFYEKASALMSTDHNSPSVLACCYRSIGQTDAMEAAARVTLERAESALVKDPANSHALAAGVGALAIFGEDERAKEWIQRGLLLDPDNLSMRYNLACTLSAELNDPESALDVLDPFFDRIISAAHIKHLEADPDFEPVRDHPRFRQQLAKAKERLGLG
jgi:adenylate cyclase